MEFEERVFKGRRPVPEKLVAYGFLPDGDGFCYKCEILNGDFIVTVQVDGTGRVAGSVTDRMNDEEYVPLRCEAFTGPYVGSVREAYASVLRGIASDCCLETPFFEVQANRIAARILEIYGISPDYPFEGGQDRSAAVFRHGEDGRWFAIVMNVRRSVLRGETGRESTDVMNLKINPADGDHLRAVPGIYPAYHMNRIHWISILLDGTLGDETVMELIGTSYRLTVKPEKKEKEMKQR